ncbi:MAG: EAL domain-containing protein, partial [Clostridia bacterium]|nr:EAL domain-containing protein [Clostridia bacterium]
LTVGIATNRCPIFYVDSGTGEPVGIGVDLMRFAAEAAGYSVSFKPIGEETLKDALDNKAYDIVMPFGSAITSTSGQPTVVSENLMQTPFTFVTTKRKSVLPPLKDLRVGMLRSLGGAIDTLGQLYPRMQIVAYESMPDCVRALRRGEVDALLLNSYIWSYVLQKPSYGDLVVQPSTMFSMDFRAGAPDTPEGRARIERLNEGIASLDDTHRQAIILDYTSRKLYRYDFADYVYQYGLIVALVVLLIFLIIVVAVQKVRSVHKWHEERVRQMMDHDPLTGLLNMNGFRKRVEELLRAHPDNPYFLSYNNIRDFKFINDSLGREAGDELLKFWARKSLENLSENEAVGRIDGDHFAVLRLIVGDDRMHEDEKNVFTPVQNFFIDQGKEHKVLLCSGIYVLTANDFRNIDVDHMLDLARVAEKRIRVNRKGDYEFYNPEQWEKGKRLAEIVNYLPAAIRAGDIRVWYQPQVDYEKGKITGAEALCRWDHTKLGWLYPFDFISTLEEAGLIYNLDCFVWETVCKDLHRWNESGVKRSVSVNVSRDDIREGRDIPGYFQNLIQAYGLTPDQLHIEITETAYVEHPETLITTTEKLRSMGFQVEMDDFGSGYSSLHMLKEVPVDRIKLDLHFLTASGDLKKSRIIVSCMVHIVHQLGMKMIAEGVETVEQANFLREQGCPEMQGYYFYKPMPVEEFEKAVLKSEAVSSDSET